MQTERPQKTWLISYLTLAATFSRNRYFCRRCMYNKHSVLPVLSCPEPAPRRILRPELLSCPSGPEMTAGHMLATTVANEVYASEAKTWPRSLVSAPVALGGEASQLICLKLYSLLKRETQTGHQDVLTHENCKVKLLLNLSPKALNFRRLFKTRGLD